MAAWAVCGFVPGDRSPGQCAERCLELAMKARHFLWGAIAQVLSRAIMLLSGLGLFLYLSRSLGPVGYGLYSVAFSVNFWWVTVTDTVMTSSLVPMLAGHPRGREYVRTGVCLSVLAGGILAAGAWISAPWVASLLQSPGLVPPLRCLVFAIPFQILSHQCLLCLVGEGKFVSAASSFSLVWLSRLLLAWCLVGAGWGPPGAALAIPASFVLQLVLCQFLGCHWIWHSGRMSLREWWAHSRDLAAGALFQGLLFGSELPLVKRFVSEAEVGYYAAAQNLGLPILAPVLSLLPVFQQRLSHLHQVGDKPAFLRQSNLVVRVLICISVATLTISLLTRELGLLLFGNRYEQSALIGRILLWEMAGRIVMSGTACILTAHGDRQRISRLFSIVTLPLLLLYPLVLGVGPRWWSGENTPPLLEWGAMISLFRTLVLVGLVFHEARSLTGVSIPGGTLARALIAGAVAGACVAWGPGSEWLVPQWLGQGWAGQGWAVLGQLFLLLGLYTGLLFLLGERWPELWQPVERRDGV